MDLDDIDQWSRELLHKEARKRGIPNAPLYSRPELIKLILRHDYPEAPKSVLEAAKVLGGLWSSAKSALLQGLPKGRTQPAEPRWQQPARVEPPAAPEPAAGHDPFPELRPPARSEDSHRPPLELSQALKSAEVKAASQPIEAPADPVHVDPAPELLPPAAEAFPAREVSLRVSTPPPPDDEATEPIEMELPVPASDTILSPWASIAPPPPSAAAPVVTAPVVELEPLTPGVDQLRYGPHPEHGLFLRWLVTAESIERARMVLGSAGELAVRIVAVRVDARAVVHTETLDHGPVEQTGDWTAPMPPHAARYVGSIGVRTQERFVSIVHAQS